MSAVRKGRIADQIRDLIAGLFLGGRLSDPRLEQVTITAVKISPDMQLASVYYRVYSDSAREPAKVALEQASGLLRNSLKSLDIRRIPRLRFFYDESLERAATIETLLSQI